MSCDLGEPGPALSLGGAMCHRTSPVRAGRRLFTLETAMLRPSLPYLVGAALLLASAGVATGQTAPKPATPKSAAPAAKTPAAPPAAAAAPAGPTYKIDGFRSAKFGMTNRVTSFIP